MGVFDFLRSKQLNPRIFSFLSGESAPSAKFQDYLDSYEGWVYACVRAIADGVSSMEFKLQRKTADGWEDVEEHQALRTLATQFWRRKGAFQHSPAPIRRRTRAPRSAAGDRPPLFGKGGR